MSLLIDTSSKRAGRADTLRMGAYLVGEAIAAGGTALVHVGLRRGPFRFRRVVAIKRLQAPFARDPEMLRMLVEEARIAALVHHPNVVPVIDVVCHDGEIALVLEWVPGLSLDALRGERKPPHACAIAIARDLLRGLDALHSARDACGALLGLVHRDVSPHNVLVGVDGVARLADFGIAKAACRERSTATGEVKGKLKYMAPEQREGKRIDARADVFAVGVVLWELLAGERLFGGRHAADPEGPVPGPRSIDSTVDPRAEHAVMRMLSFSASQRPSSAAEALGELEALRLAAPAVEVADWVRAVGADALRRVSDACEQLVGGEASEPVSVSPSANEVTRTVVALGRSGHGRTSASRSLVLGIALASLVGSAYALVRTPPLATSGAAGSASAATSAMGASQGTSPPASAIHEPSRPVALPAPASSVAGNVQQHPADPPLSAVRRHAIPRASAAQSDAAAAPNTAAADCARPFFVDDRGIKIFRPECL